MDYDKPYNPQDEDKYFNDKYKDPYKDPYENSDLSDLTLENKKAKFLIDIMLAMGWKEVNHEDAFRDGGMIPSGSNLWSFYNRIEKNSARVLYFDIVGCAKKDKSHRLYKRQIALFGNDDIGAGFLAGWGLKPEGPSLLKIE